MLSTDINEAAVELGRSLRQAPSVAIHRIAAEALEADPVARELLADLREHHGSLARTQRAGLTPNQEQIDRMRLCQAAVRGNEAIVAHLRATNEVKALRAELGRQLREHEPWEASSAALTTTTIGSGGSSAADVGFACYFGLKSSRPDQKDQRRSRARRPPSVRSVDAVAGACQRGLPRRIDARSRSTLRLTGGVHPPPIRTLHAARSVCAGGRNLVEAVAHRSGERPVQHETLSRGEQTPPTERAPGSAAGGMPGRSPRYTGLRYRGREGRPAPG